MVNNKRAVGIGGPQLDFSPFPIVSNRAPSTTDLGYNPGQDWIDNSTLSVYILAGNVGGQASWVKTGSSAAGDVSQITGNAGTCVPQVSGNVNIVGTGNVSVSCAGNTATISDISGGSVTPYIVGPTGDYTTIQDALNAANAAGGGTIYIQDGSYSENLSLFTNCSIVSSAQDATAASVTIIGNHNPPLTGFLKIRGCVLESGSDIISSVGAGSTTITIDNCTIVHTGAGSLFNLNNWNGLLNVVSCSDQSTAASSICQTAAGGANLIIQSSLMGSGGIPCQVVNAEIFNSRIGCSLFTTSGTLEIGNAIFDRSIDITNGSYFIINALIQTSFIIGGTANGILFGSYLQNSLTINATASISAYNCALSAIIQNSASAVFFNDCSINAAVPAVSGAGLGSVELVSTVFLSDDTIAVAVYGTAGTYYAGDIINDGIIRTTGSHIIQGANNVLAFTSQTTGPCAGTVTLVAGAAIVTTSTVTATSKIFLTVQTLGTVAVPQAVHVSARTPGVSFGITSADVTDTSVVNWLIVEQF